MIPFPVLDSHPSTLDLRTLTQMGEPKHRVLAGFVHGCSPDPATRTVATTALVISLWQLAGRGMSHQPPSLILLNAGEAAADPINAFTGLLVMGGNTEPQEYREGPFMHGAVELAPRAMAATLRVREEISGEFPWQREQIASLEGRYLAAQRTGFGSGRSRSYGQAWHGQFGLLTDCGDQLILRVEAPADHAAFREHIINAPVMLLDPVGTGAGLRLVRKHIAVSGTLTRDLWDEKLAAGIINLGLPFLFLPHLALEPLVTANLPALDYITKLLPDVFHNPLVEPTSLPPNEWCDAYASDLRMRLRELPGAYEYAVQRAVRQLVEVCLRLASWAGRQSNATTDEIEALFWDLHSHTLRGIVIGVASLAWHGIGFDPGCPRTKALKVLQDLRGKGEMHKSDLQRCAHLKKDERDILLDRLAAEDLIRVDGSQVAAASFAGFVAALHARKEFPEVPDCWALASGGGKAPA